MTVFEELQARGLIAQCTNEERAKEKLNNGGTTFYIGFDATADSLHVGHFLQLVVTSWLQKAGNHPLLLLGGGTTLIGDPSGRTDMRQMLTEEQIDYNIECFKKQMSRIVDIDNAKFVNNADWLKEMKYVELLRDYGAMFSVNRMLAAECFKSRWEQGLTFFEFNYMIMQSIDFLKLYETENCTMQLGGNDQWSNIISGANLVRRVHGEEAIGMTFTLLTTKDGIKMGKTQKGALWLDPEKTSPYEFFQYWRNIDDEEVIKCMKMLTFIPLDEIAKYEELEGSELNKVKEILAFEVTKLVHGEEEAQKSLEAARAVFEGGGVSEEMPTTQLKESDFKEGKIEVLELLVKTSLAKSKSEARRLVTQGGISVDGEKVTDIAQTLSLETLKAAGECIVKKGKKVFHKVTL